MSTEGDWLGKPRRDVDSCPHRRITLAASDSSSESAVCQLVSKLVDLKDEWVVERAACQACVQSFEPTVIDPNPVVASLAFTAAEARLAELDPDNDEYRRVAAQRDRADANLPRVLPHEDDLGAENAAERAPLTLADLKQIVPPPANRLGPRVQEIVVGITTAPRRQSTADKSVEGLIRCGFAQPHLFVDGNVDLSPRLSSMRSTRRSEPAGAWHNFFLGLLELVERHPRADAFLMVQDDALWPLAPDLASYLADCLWPDAGNCIVSLYTSADDVDETPGWRPLPRVWKYGALALLFPCSVARRLTGDPSLRKYGWSHGPGVAGVDLALGQWAERQRIGFWHPTPSLVQHVGHVSAIWPTSRAVGLRRASRWIGDGEAPS